MKCWQGGCRRLIAAGQALPYWVRRIGREQGMALSSPKFDFASNSGEQHLGRALQVLAVAASPEQIRAWRERLTGERFAVFDQAAHFSEAAPPDVIVTDQPLTAAEFHVFHPLMIRGEIGVVMVGRNLPADVVLPVDASGRELRLACRLLAQVVTLRRQNRKLTQLSDTDPLTQLANRRAFTAEFERVIPEANHGATVAILALIDLDQFKTVNQQGGMLQGDEVLRKVAQTLRVRSQPHFVARWGGDEFVMLVRAERTESAMTTIEECRQAMGRAASLTAARPLSASAGAITLNSSDTLTEAIAAAEQALQAAKAAGGKRLVY